jgi:molybdate transport repressor ModE-like protein
MNIGVKLHPKLALANAADEEFCGAGLLQLLAGIATHGSIQQAARDMGLSYVKALRILNRLERELGTTCLRRHKGGAARGRTELTPFAREFLRDFTALRRTVQRAADRAFVRFRRKYAGVTPRRRA